MSFFGSESVGRRTKCVAHVPRRPTKVVPDQDRELNVERQRNDKLERLVETLMQRMADLEEQTKAGTVSTK
ncbi:MAG: hypothetical protein H7062_19725 [Candidatus Saccharimonas sp.]|nr:hypothetical protein [Planctomycetaceae bacterium]